MLSDIVRESAAKFEGRIALQHLGTAQPRQLSYLELADWMSRGSAALSTRRTRDAVVLLLAPQPAWIAALFSIFDAGLVAVPVSPGLPDNVIADISREIRPGVAVVSDVCDEGTRRALGCPTVTPASLFQSPVSTRSRTGDHDASDLALLALTSGSTGRPRAVELTHANLLSNVRAILTQRDPLPDERLLSLLPPEHLFELVVGQLCPLAAGAQILYPPSLLPSRLFDAVRQQRVTRVVAVPALLDLLYEEVMGVLVDAGLVNEDHRHHTLSETARALAESDDHTRVGFAAAFRAGFSDSLQALVVGGAAIDPAWSMLCVALGLHLDVGYGLTEAGPVVSFGSAATCPPGSVGRPLPGVEVSIGERDEILVRGDGIMRGYYGDAAATTATLADGWLHTGDQGRVDDNGFLFVVGRLKEAIVTSAGTTVYPEEVEPYYRNPLFAELCVVPLRGAHGNDVPVLLVVPNSAHATDEEIDETVHRLRTAAPSHCRVERVERLPQPLPRTATGKVRRRVLADQLTRKEKSDVIDSD